MSPTKIRLGTASPATQPTTTATLVELADLARRAAALHIDLLLLPEAYIGGYPRGSSFGCVVGGRTAAGRDEYLRYYQSAVDLGDTIGDGGGAGSAWVRKTIDGDEDGDTVVEDGLAKNGETTTSLTSRPRRGDGTREELERIAHETGVFLVTGCIEKVGGSLYCATVYVCPRLGMIGKRRKVQPTGSERLVWAQGSPATLRAVSTTLRGVRINLAAAICWENYMPLVRQALYTQNVNLYLAPTADQRDTWLPLLRTVALEGRCFVVSSNMCVRGGDGGSGSGVGVGVGVGAETTDGHRHDEHGSGSEDPHHHGGGVSSGVVAKRRRASCVTEDGFEIALPARSAAAAAAAAATSPTSPTSSASASLAPLSTAFVSRGGSAIVSPLGDVLAGPQWEDDEGIIYADVDFDDCIRGRLDLDAAGSYSRNDSFKFSVHGLKLTPLPY